MDKILLAIKNAGMRKMFFATLALVALTLLCAFAKLGGQDTNGTIFRDCFIALCGFVMGANYGEHNAKSKEVKADAAPVADSAK